MNRFLGGILGPAAAERLDWRFPQLTRWLYPNAECLLAAEGDRQVFERGQLLAIVRGYAVPKRDGHATQGRELARFVCSHYEKHHELPIEELEGNYSLVLVDRRAGQVLLYRNLVGNTFLYYAPVPEGFLFSSNLTTLADALDNPRTNEAVLPAFFFFRYVPGRDTLFSGVFRLMPGELVQWGPDGVHRSQHECLPQPGTSLAGQDAVEQLHEVVGNAVADCSSAFPKAANLLSGGVDSSYIQCLLGRTRSGKQIRPPSFSLSVDHPQTRSDTEYARSAAALLGTDHQLVAADAPYSEQLIAAIAATGEPPHHVQSVYYPSLARAMVSSGSPVGVCGQGADALFGLGWVTMLRRAQAVRRWLPFRFLRRWALRMAGRRATPFRQQYMTLADHLDDPESPHHPLNLVAAYGTWSDVTACFGTDEATRVLAERRELLLKYGATSGGLVAQVHACDFLTDSIDSAALWAGLFSVAGGDLVCPFLDSRVVRFAMGLSPQVRFGGTEPKALLKEALARHAPRELAYRTKLAFGQPIFEWLEHGGQLRQLAERIAHYDFLDASVRTHVLARPNWFLYSLLCYDVWHKLFIDRSLPRPQAVQPRFAPQVASLVQ
jgi:asparagine synthase (glutamine-hydrolysing)